MSKKRNNNRKKKMSGLEERNANLMLIGGECETLDRKVPVAGESRNIPSLNIGSFSAKDDSTL